MSTPKRRWLALDISLTCTGWAVLEGTADDMTLLDYGHIKTTKRAGKLVYTTGQRLRTIYDTISGVVQDYPTIDKVVPREDGFVKFANATKQIQRAVGVTEMALSDYEIIDINPSIPKKWAREYLGIGYNRTDKEMVEEAVRTFLKLPDLQFATDDESDAVAVGLAYGLGLHMKDKAGK
jgi:Holliday junction resolvasome RuvABC endonuclease subunit